MIGELYYYGCWRVAGHYLHDSTGRVWSTQQKIPFGNHIDGLFAPPFVNGREDVTALTHIHGWTVLSMWDRSVDHRSQSNATFLASGTHSEAEMWQRAREVYPWIVARLKAAPAVRPAGEEP